MEAPGCGCFRMLGGGFHKKGFACAGGCLLPGLAALILRFCFCPGRQLFVSVPRLISLFACAGGFS
jgi:hypothetical protein